MKHIIYRWHLIAFFIFLYSDPLYANQPFESGEQDIRTMDIFDDASSFEDDMFINGFLDTISFDTISHRSISVQNILGLLQAAGAFTILEDDFYRHTNPFAVRPLVDLPIWELHGCREPKEWIVGGQLFWNHQDRSVFTCKSTDIKSYLNLDQELLFEKLNELTPQIKNLFPNASIVDELLDNTHVRELIGLFENFTVQQRRIGVMFDAWRQWTRAEIRMLLPFYYLERNIFLRPDEQAALESQFGALEPDTAQQFQQNHAISDKVGFGDFRFEADYALFASDTYAFRFGAFVTLPTAFAISKGLQGTTFCTSEKQPTFELQSLFDLIPDDFNVDSITQQDLDKARDIIIGDICKNKNGFFLGVIDRLNAILLESPLGDYRHIGFGGMIRSRTLLSNFIDEFEWAERLSFNNRLGIEYLTAAYEPRFFVRRNLPSDFSSRDFQSDDEKIQKENLEFLQQALVNKFYPFAVQTKVQPGVAIRWTSRWCFCGDIWEISIGSDMWFQTPEKFKGFKCVATELSRLDINAGKVGFAYQFTTFAGFGIKIIRPTHSFVVSINAEGTSWNKLLGEEITAALNIEANF